MNNKTIKIKKKFILVCSIRVRAVHIMAAKEQRKGKYRKLAGQI
jgi:hypothetical protein